MNTRKIIVFAAAVLFLLSAVAPPSQAEVVDARGRAVAPARLIRQAFKSGKLNVQDFINLLAEDYVANTSHGRRPGIPFGKCATPELRLIMENDYLLRPELRAAVVRTPGYSSTYDTAHFRVYY